MFKYIRSSFPFSGNTTKRARMKQNSIPYIFKINISGRRDNYTDVLISLRYRQLKNFGNLNIFISIYSEKKQNLPIIMSYCNKIKLCSFKAKKLRKLIIKDIQGMQT